MWSGVDSDSHSVLKSVSNNPAPRSCDSRMMEENDMRYSTCPISSAMVCKAPLITWSVMGSMASRDMVLSPSGAAMDMQIAKFGYVGDIAGRQQDGRVVLDQDRRSGDPMPCLEPTALVAARIDG